MNARRHYLAVARKGLTCVCMYIVFIYTTVVAEHNDKLYTHTIWQLNTIFLLYDLCSPAYFPQREISPCFLKVFSSLFRTNYSVMPVNTQFTKPFSWRDTNAPLTMWRKHSVVICYSLNAVNKQTNTSWHRSSFKPCERVGYTRKFSQTLCSRLR